MPEQRLAAAQKSRGSRCQAQPRKRFGVLRETDFDSSTSCRTCDGDSSRIAHQASQAFPVGVQKFIRRGVECFLVVIGTKIVGRVLKNRLWRCGGIDIHSTYRTERVFSAGNWRGRVNLVRIGIHPAKPLIFHVIGCLLRDLAAEIAFDDAECEIKSRGESPSSSEVAILDEPGSTLEVDIRKLVGKRNKCTVVRGRGFA